MRSFHDMNVDDALLNRFLLLLLFVEAISHEFNDTKLDGFPLEITSTFQFHFSFCVFNIALDPHQTEKGFPNAEWPHKRYANWIPLHSASSRLKSSRDEGLLRHRIRPTMDFERFETRLRANDK